MPGLRSFWASALILLPTASLLAQPFIPAKGIVNAASFAPPGLSTGFIAQGSIFSIFGKNLGPPTAAQVSAFPLQATFEGVAVRVSQGNKGVDAIPIYVSASQLNVIMPSNAPLGRVSIKVSYVGGSSNPSQVNVVASSVGIFSFGGGFGPGIIQNFNSDSDQPLNSGQKPAKPGQTVTLWGTGLGPGLNADNVSPQYGSLPIKVEVFVGGAAAQVAYSGRSSCCSGLDQIVFQVPSNIPAGCFVPVQVRTAATNVSNATTMAISSEGGTCSDPANPFGSTLLSGGTAALISLERHDLIEDIDFRSPHRYVDDHGALVIGRTPTGPSAFHALSSLPPLGSCTYYTPTGQALHPSARPFLSTALSAGANLAATASVTVANGKRTVGLKGAQGVYFGRLGASDSMAAPLFLDGVAGFDLAVAATDPAGSFSVTVPPPVPVNWTNRGQTGAINRNQDLKLAWAPVASGLIVITGGNYDQTINASGVFLCTAPASAGSLIVPAYVLAGIPASRQQVGQTTGYVQMGLLPAKALTFAAAGLDAGLAISVSWMDKAVLFQ